MRHPIGSLVGCAAAVLAVSAAARASPPVHRTPAEVLVVYNGDSPVSKSVALDYAQKRKVNDVLVIHTVDSAVRTADETIPMDAYRSAVEAPVKRYLAHHPRVQFIVLTKGVPLRIRGSDTGQRGEHTPPTTPLTTSLDDHLASLGYADLPGTVRLQITGSGATGNGYRNRYWDADEPFSHATFGGYLVARLDGYTEADAKSLVTRALEAEARPPTGKVLLDVQPRFGMGTGQAEPADIKGTVILTESAWGTWNADMKQVHALLDERHIPNELDLDPAFVGDRTDLAGYYSWGSNDARYRTAAYQSLRFAPGSICDTAVSTSARTFLPTHGGQSLIVDLVKHGLTCGQGYTDEPLLQGTSSPTVDLERYTSGYTMAEAFAMGTRFKGWQTVVIGDPLCCPYGKR